jgi:hypothetical protein
MRVPHRIPEENVRETDLVKSVRRRGRRGRLLGACRNKMARMPDRGQQVLRGGGDKRATLSCRFISDQAGT